MILLTYRRQTVLPQEQTRGLDVAKLFLSKFGPSSGIFDARTNDFDAAIPRNAARPVNLQYACCVVLPIADCNHDSSYKQT